MLSIPSRSGVQSILSANRYGYKEVAELLLDESLKEIRDFLCFLSIETWDNFAQKTYNLISLLRSPKRFSKLSQ